MISGSSGQDPRQGQKTCRRSLLPLLVILALISVLLSGCKKGKELPSLKRGENFNLLLITIDSLRVDRIEAYGSKNARTPNINRLAENGWMFKSCYASVPLSLPSHGTIFTGREPLAQGVRNDDSDILPDSELTWAEVMKSHGFETYGLVSSYLLHSKFGLKQGFDVFDDSLDYGSLIHNVRTGLAADRVYSRFQSWLESWTPHKFFGWVHFSDPQAPYEPPQEYAKMFENDPYSGEVAFVDHYVGEIVRTLEAKKLLDRTVVVIAGSHGESLHEHREWGHGLFCYEPTLRVPLIIYSPAVFKEKRVVASRVRLLDLMPSLLQLFNLEIPAGIQGQSFLHLLSKKNRDPQVDQPVYFESLYGSKEMNFARLTGLISEDYKFISLPEAELYDLKADPAETENLVSTKSDVAQRMQMEVRRHFEQQLGKEQEATGKVQQSREDSRAVDPKKGIDAIERMIEVEGLIFSEKWREAEDKLHGIRSDFNGWKLPQLDDEQHLIDKKINDPRKTEETLRQAAEKHPESLRFKFALAQFFVSSGRLGEAEKIYTEELARNPRLSQANILLGTIFQKTGRTAQALSCLEKALDQEPQNIRLQLEYAARLADLGKKEKSLEILKNLLKIRSLAADPAGPDVQAEIGGLLIKIGEFEMANAWLLDLVASGKGNSMTWTQIGLGYFNKGDLEKARESLEKALALDSHNALALSGLGTFHLTLFGLQKQEDDLQKAIAYYTRAKEASPELASAINGLGVAFRYSGDFERAISCWKQVLDIDPGFTDTYFNLGITLIETGRKQEALKYLNVCQNKYSDRLSEKERQQLDSLISEIK